MSGEAVPQRVGMHVFLNACSLSSLLASVPDYLGVDRRITGVPAVTGEQPRAWPGLQATPVLTQLLEQFGTEHHIAVFASLAAPDVNHHTLAIDVAHS